MNHFRLTFIFEGISGCLRGLVKGLLKVQRVRDCLLLNSDPEKSQGFRTRHNSRAVEFVLSEFFRSGNLGVEKLYARELELTVRRFGALNRRIFIDSLEHFHII